MRDSRRNTTPKNTITPILKAYVFEAIYWGMGGTLNKEKIITRSNSIAKVASELRDKGAANILSLQRIN